MSREQLRPTPAKEILGNLLERVEAKRDGIQIQALQDCAELDIAEAEKRAAQMTQGAGGENSVMEIYAKIGDKMRGDWGRTYKEIYEDYFCIHPPTLGYNTVYAVYYQEANESTPPGQSPIINASKKLLADISEINAKLPL